MSTLAPVSGIYQIFCIPTGKIYIGSSANIAARWRSHRSDLRKQRFINTHLQYAWNKYGVEGFVFTILEEVPPALLLEREQYYLDLLTPYDPSIGYNIATIAAAPMKGRHHTPEAIRRMAASSIGFKHTEATKQLMSERNKGKWFGRYDEHGNRLHFHADHLSLEATNRLRSRMQSSEMRQKISAIRKDRQIGAKRFMVTSPSGDVIHVFNLKKFCTEHNLDLSTMYKVMRGQRKDYKGWTCKHDD